MSRIQIRVSLESAEAAELRIRAERRGMRPATLAAEILKEWLARSPDDRQGIHPAAELKEWLQPVLQEIRQRDGWPPDITVEIFDLIRDQAGDLYAAAIADVDQKTLNREIGRMIKEGLGARVISDEHQRPKTINVSRKRGSLIKVATLLEPNTGARS